MTDKSPWKSTAKIETIEVPAVGKFVEGTVATVYAMTDNTDLVRRLREDCAGDLLDQEAADAIERESKAADMIAEERDAWEKRAKALEADNVALREHIADIHNRVRHELYADIEAAQCKAFKAMSGSKVLRDAAMLAGKNADALEGKK